MWCLGYQSYEPLITYLFGQTWLTTKTGCRSLDMLVFFFDLLLFFRQFLNRKIPLTLKVKRGPSHLLNNNLNSPIKAIGLKAYTTALSHWPREMCITHNLIYYYYSIGFTYMFHTEIKQSTYFIKYKVSY